MDKGCFWCLLDDDKIVGTIAIRMIDDANAIVELKRRFVLPECQETDRYNDNEHAELYFELVL